MLVSSVLFPVSIILIRVFASESGSVKIIVREDSSQKSVMDGKPWVVG